MLDAVFYCPHAPNDACGCRKPAIGMGRLASDQFGVAPSSMFVVGDQPSDVAFGIALGSVTVLIDAQGSSTVSADHVTGGLFEAALWIRDHLVAAGVGAEPASTSTKGP